MCDHEREFFERRGKYHRPGEAFREGEFGERHHARKEPGCRIKGALLGLSLLGLLVFGTFALVAWLL